MMLRRMVRVLVSAALVVVCAAGSAQADSACRKGCAASKRTCVGGAKDLFRAAKAGCGSALDRKVCKKTARTDFRNLKKGCAAALRSCRSCCSGRSGITAAACTGPGSPVDTSAICPEARGGLATYWDWLNGVFHPLSEIPTPGLGWIPFQHVDYPLLGFLHPPDWTPVQLRAEQTVGVELYRGDSAAVWRFFATWGDVRPGARALRDAELGGALQFLGNPGPVRTVCVDEEQAVLAPGVAAAGSNIAVQAGAFTIITLARVTTLEGLAGGQIIWNTIVMPTAELDQLVFGVYMPIHFQLFIGERVQDSDLDGVPDSTDDFPNDPRRS